MIKTLLALTLLASPLLINNAPKAPLVNDGLIVEQNERGNYTLTGVSSVNSEEIRIYYNESTIIDEISDTAFTTCTQLNSLMISKCVLYVNDAAFIDSISTVNYTGSQEQFEALNITKEFTKINYYACDEGFINYWNEKVRTSAEVSICDMSKSDFQALYALYSNLSLTDRKTVDETKDIANEKIGESMAVLINQFKTPQSSQPKNEWKQSGAITFIIIVSVIGMTSICVFFLLKTKQIIS